MFCWAAAWWKSWMTEKEARPLRVLETFVVPKEFVKHMLIWFCLEKQAGGFKLKGKIASDEADHITIWYRNQQVCAHLQSSNCLPLPSMQYITGWHDSRSFNQGAEEDHVFRWLHWSSMSFPASRLTVKRLKEGRRLAGPLQTLFLSVEMKERDVKDQK